MAHWGLGSVLEMYKDGWLVAAGMIVYEVLRELDGMQIGVWMVC